ncbi:hypothetical protein JCM16138_01070 [Thermococcus atlanticus]
MLWQGRWRTGLSRGTDTYIDEALFIIYFLNSCSKFFPGDIMGFREFLEEWRRRCPFIRTIEKWRFERKRNKFEVKKR